MERRRWSDSTEEVKEPQGITVLSAYSTFSLSPENEGPQRGDHLKLVVAQSSHQLDGAGQDHALGVHLLKAGGEGRVNVSKPRQCRIMFLPTSLIRSAAPQSLLSSSSPSA